MNNKINKKLYGVLAFETLIILLVHVFNTNNLYAFFLSEDELGYWGNAAFFLGKDWGNTVSYCPYYSYGYSVFLMLILSLPISALMMYRLAVFANAIFMAISFFVSYYLFKNLLPKRNKFFVSIVCTAMALYGSYISWSSIAWSECYLILFVWLILLQGYLVCKKSSSVKVIIFAVELVYIYMIHQRTMSFLISGIVLVFLLTIYKKVPVKQLVLMLVLIITMLYFTTVFKENLKLSIYGANKSKNDYSSILAGMSFSNLFMPVIREMAGQLYYLWAASFGIIPLGIGVTVWAFVKKWKEKDIISFFGGFTILSFLGTLMISSVFMRMSVRRIDYLIYGRYNEIAVGFFIIIGFLCLPDFVRCKKSCFFMVIASACFAGLTFLLVNKIQLWNISLDTSYQGINAVGTYFFYSLRGFRAVELCVVVLTVETAMFVLLKRLSTKGWFFTVPVIFMVVFWVISGQTVIKQQICRYQVDNNQDLSIKDNLWDYISGHYDKVVFLTNTEYSLRGSIQFYLRDIPLICVQDIKELDFLPDILIIDYDDSSINEDFLEEYYFVCLVGKKRVFSKDRIRLNNMQGEINKNLFAFNQIGEDESGYVMYGPYICLEPGFYEVTFQMNEAINEQSELGLMDVACEVGNKVICSKSWNGGAEIIRMQFFLEEKTDNIEFRYYKYSGNITSPVRVFLNGVED